MYSTHILGEMHFYLLHQTIFLLYNLLVVNEISLHQLFSHLVCLAAHWVLEQSCSLSVSSSLFFFLDKDKSDSKKTVVTSDSNSAASADSLKDPSEKAKDMTFDPTVSEGNLPTVPAAQGSKKDPLSLRNKLKKVRATFTSLWTKQIQQKPGESGPTCFANFFYFNYTF